MYDCKSIMNGIWRNSLKEKSDGNKKFHRAILIMETW